MDYNFFKIKEYKYWTLYLQENQCYLGRFYLLSKRIDAIDFIDMNYDERKDFFLIACKVKNVLHKLFRPDLMNYAALGNRFKRLHVHFIPRYKTKREFCNITFIDARWGMNYAPYDKSLFIPQQCLYGIKNLIKNTLSGI